MQSLTVVVAHCDSAAAQQLTNSLRAHFRRVAVACDEGELRDAIERNRAHMAIVDLDMVSLKDLKELCECYSSTGVVCVHRAPDFEMWNAATGAGALECCHPSELPAILNAMRNKPVLKSRKAAA
jgi:DNA-binding NtrC family response regulator